MSCFLKSEVFDGLWAHDESLPTRSDQPSPPGTLKGYFLFSMLGVIFSICQQPSLVLKKKKYLYGLCKYNFPKKNIETVFLFPIQPAGLNIKKTPIYPRINTSDADVGISPFVLLHPDKETSPLEYTDQHLQPLARERCTVSLGLG